MAYQKTERSIFAKFVKELLSQYQYLTPLYYSVSLIQCFVNKGCKIVNLYPNLLIKIIWDIVMSNDLTAW